MQETYIFIDSQNPKVDLLTKKRGIDAILKKDEWTPEEARQVWQKLDQKDWSKIRQILSIEELEQEELVDNLCSPKWFGSLLNSKPGSSSYFYRTSSLGIDIGKFVLAMLAQMVENTVLGIRLHYDKENKFDYIGRLFLLALCLDANTKWGLWQNIEDFVSLLDTPLCIVTDNIFYDSQYHAMYQDTLCMKRLYRFGELFLCGIFSPKSLFGSKRNTTLEQFPLLLRIAFSKKISSMNHISDVGDFFRPWSDMVLRFRDNGGLLIPKNVPRDKLCVRIPTLLEYFVPKLNLH